MDHPFTRRSLLRGVAGLAGASLLGGSSPLLFHSPPLTPFRDALPSLPMLTGSEVTVEALAGTHRFHRDLGPSPAFGYRGADYLGPVIEAHSGVRTRLTYRNQLSHHVFAQDIDPTVHGALEADRTTPRSVMHLHGGVTPPEHDGHPEATILPGQQVLHEFPNRQEAAALWYHDHAIGITRLNVYAGLAGMYLVRDEWDTGRAGNPLGLPAGEFEIPLMLQEKIFTSDGAQSMRSTPLVPRGSWEGGSVGDVGVVNGTVWPELSVARGLYRFRIINAGSLSVWNLFFGNRMRFWVIGNDGGLLDAPVPTTSVRLSPAERIDVLVDFGALAPGTTVELRNDEPVAFLASTVGSVSMPLFCRFRVGSARGFTGSVPDTLRGGSNQPPGLPPAPIPQRVRDLTVNLVGEVRLPPTMMTLNNLEFHSPDIEMPRQGTVEQWNLINVTTDPHPIHLHLVNFRILGRQPINTVLYRLLNPTPPIGTRWTPSVEAFTTGPLTPPDPWEAGAKDTVRTDPNTVTRILVRFPTADELGFDPDATFGVAAHHAQELAPALQGYMWHCHVLDHEDHDMMLRYRLLA